VKRRTPPLFAACTTAAPRRWHGRRAGCCGASAARWARKAAACCIPRAPGTVQHSNSAIAAVPSAEQPLNQRASRVLERGSVGARLHTCTVVRTGKFMSRTFFCLRAAFLVLDVAARAVLCEHACGMQVRHETYVYDFGCTSTALSISELVSCASARVFAPC